MQVGTRTEAASYDSPIVHTVRTHSIYTPASCDGARLNGSNDSNNQRLNGSDDSDLVQRVYSNESYEVCCYLNLYAAD
jgi:hypothetical protein